MKRKLHLLFILTLLSFALVTGCTDTEKPGDVAIKFLKGFYANDITSAKKYLELPADTFFLVFSENPDQFTRAISISGANVVSETEVNDSTVFVLVKIDADTLRINMKRKEGNWKVSMVTVQDYIELVKYKPSICFALASKYATEYYITKKTKVEAATWYDAALKYGANDTSFCKQVKYQYADYLFQSGKDIKGSIKIMEGLALGGYRTAAHRLALFFEMTRNYEKERYWYLMLAGMGDSIAMGSLGDFYLHTNNSFQNQDSAIFWYEQAANHNNIGIMTYLGIIYRDGQDVPVDRAKSKYWLSRAAEAGDTTAIRLLKNMK